MCLLSRAGSETVLDVVFQTRVVLSLSDGLFGEGEVAAADGIHLADELEHVVERGGVGERPVVFAVFAVDLSRLENAGKVFVRDTYGRIGLVVLQQDVVAGLVLLDEVVFEQQRIFVGRHHDVVDVLNLGHQYFCLPPVHAFHEIGGDAALQIFGLADVDDVFVLVEILVAPGRFGHVENDVLQSLDAFLVFREFPFCCFHFTDLCGLGMKYAQFVFHVEQIGHKGLIVKIF